jgi:hypothetical protein
MWLRVAERLECERHPLVVSLLVVYLLVVYLLVVYLLVVSILMADYAPWSRGWPNLQAEMVVEALVVYLKYVHFVTRGVLEIEEEEAEQGVQQQQQV